MKKKLFAFFLILAASIGITNAVTANGTCGDNLTWSLNTEDSTLTIEGSGEMTDWEGAGDLPWYEIRSNVAHIELPIGLTKIGQCAFNGFENLTTLEIPQNVTEIGKYAFSWSYKLASIIVELNNLTYCSIDGVLFNKEKTQLIEYPEGKTGTSYTIINSVESIGECAFANSQYLDSITIPGSVTNIGKDAFQNSSLSKVNITNLAAWCTKNYDGWGYSGFNIFYDLYLNGDLVTNVRIPESVISLGKFAFSQCKSITSVTIPSNVATIGFGVFLYSEHINEIYNYAAIPQSITTASFSRVNKSTCVLYVPEESIDLYREAEGWKEFTNILAIPGTSVDITAKEDPQHVGTYYSTFYYSSGHYELPAAGVEAFVATVSGSDMNLTRIAGGAGVIPQGTAVILRSNIQNYTLTPSDDATDFEGANVLQGVDAATTTPTNCYVLSAVDGVVGFYQYTGEQVGAHKAYLVYSGAGAPRRMRFVFDEENAATGVDVMEQPYMDVQKRIKNGQLIIIRDGVRYNAQGQKVK